MKRKILVCLLSGLTMLSLFGCGKTEEEIVEPKKTTIIVSKDDLTVKQELSEISAEDVELQEQLAYQEYRSINDMITLSNANLLLTFENNENPRYLYNLDSELCQFLYNMRDNYDFVFNYEMETDEMVYKAFLDETYNCGYTQFHMNNETIDQQSPSVSENEVADEVTEENIIIETPYGEGYGNFDFTLYKTDSVSIYTKDKELLVKDARSVNDVSIASTPNQ